MCKAVFPYDRRAHAISIYGVYNLSDQVASCVGLRSSKNQVKRTSGLRSTKARASRCCACPTGTARRAAQHRPRLPDCVGSWVRFDNKRSPGLMDARLLWSALPTCLFSSLESTTLLRLRSVTTTSSFARGALVFRLYLGTLQPIQAGPCSRTTRWLHS